MIREKASLGLCAMNIETYNVCNLRCVMCSYPKMTREKVQMSMDLFRKIIDDAAQSGIRRVCLHLYSEPLLDSLLFERIKYVKSKGLWVEFASNGTPLTRDKIDLILDSGLDSINFSIDAATRETYRKIRGADFDRTRNNIIKLIEEREKRGCKKPLISTSFVVERDNYREIKEFISFWKKRADRIGIWRVDDRRQEGLVPYKTKPTHVYPCPMLFTSCAVMSNGKVVLCCLDYDGSTVIGDLNNQSLAEIWNSKKFTKIRQAHINRHGDKIKLCKNLRCDLIYTQGSYLWWV
ncbi:GTP 3',8-cyclase [subsurface metagenome]